MKISSGPSLFTKVLLYRFPVPKGLKEFWIEPIVMCRSGNGKPLVKSAYQKQYFSYFSTKTYVVGTQKNRLNETVLLNTQNIC